MRDHYDFSKAIKNPYISGVKKQISIRIDTDVLEYFKQISDEVGIPYQKLINFYLAECASKHLKPEVVWKQAVKK